MELLEIEKELAGPEKVAVMERYDAVLVALDERRQAALAKGVPPEEYARVKALGETVTVARKLLRLQVRGKREEDRG